MHHAACLGLGDLGRLEARVLDSLDGVRLVGGADPSPDARDRFESELHRPAYETLDDLLTSEDVDLVTIVTPHTLHYDQARECLSRDVHVHIEKPMVTERSHADDLIARADAHGLVLAVGYQRHFDPRFREIRRLVDDGRIGRPHMVVGHLEQEWIRWTQHQWRSTPDLSGGGQLYDSGSHLLDVLCWTLRAEPTTVTATVDRRGHDVDVNSALTMTLERRESAVRTRQPNPASITASVGVSGDGTSVPDPGESLRIWGTDGTISFDGDTITVREAGMTYETTPSVPDFEELTRRKLGNVVDAIDGEAELEIPATDGRRVVALTEAAYEAAERGERVSVPGPEK
ncbi:gfo/Idh/MocA family oxidoreductase [Salinigranum rubrum]|uniref:Gfo/Idh/MocA family oxidoreductase n=1 Tax=Salinigranum rubrum TaxID=755307 RepID=A0A2I8VHD6_9EURY|nr:Gfo/Idh/MocA family oxidoreductase [Salinigranum rubrum]AUV81353.1 gfo/Idh/MocA family oxidoreductase [Salinigranum rubrum]